MDAVKQNLLKQIADLEEVPMGAFSLRENGQGVMRNSTENIEIIPKEDQPGIDIIVHPDTHNESVHIPVIITQSGMTDLVYNDFYIGTNADVTIVAGCGIHTDACQTSQHAGIHTFHLDEGAHVRYVEKHYGEGTGTGKRVLNPQTIIYLDENASLEMETVQIKGVDSSVRETNAFLEDGANLIVSERIMTHDNQSAKTIFHVELNGEDSSVHVASRSVAQDSSSQEFLSHVVGNAKCFGHVECDAIMMDSAKVVSSPTVEANHIDASLVHEAAIGKIAGEQLIKLMSLGLTEKQAEEHIIGGFLK